MPTFSDKGFITADAQDGEDIVPRMSAAPRPIRFRRVQKGGKASHVRADGDL
jgi:hypothetical protein